MISKYSKSFCMPSNMLAVSFVGLSVLLTACSGGLRDRHAANQDGGHNPQIKPVSTTGSLAETNDTNSTTKNITKIMNRMVEDKDLDGAALIIRRGNETLYAKSFGAYDLQTRIPVASATKIVTGAVLASVIERDGLKLDHTLGAFFPDIGDDKKNITVRQILSHTSGFPGKHPLRASINQTMKQATPKLIGTKLTAKPGSAVQYGGMSFQIAGRIAEIQSGRSWPQLFAQRIAQPLGWKNAAWEHPMKAAPYYTDWENGPTNPGLGGGLHVSAEDFIGFMQMLDQGGEFHGNKVLSPTVINEMMQDNTNGLDKSKIPPIARKEDPKWGYGLGGWCEMMNSAGHCTVFSSAGAFGAMPWRDEETGIYGVFMVKSRLPKVYADIKAVRKLARQIH